MPLRDWIARPTRPTIDRVSAKGDGFASLNKGAQRRAHVNVNEDCESAVGTLRFAYPTLAAATLAIPYPPKRARSSSRSKQHESKG
jgi:hypothetical protein